jgi:hypothetical protein
VRPSHRRRQARHEDRPQETFAPILYVISYREFEDAIAYNNEVPQGLEFAIFTNNMHEAELFVSARGSDCGIANVNIGTSGAEIGGAFGARRKPAGGARAAVIRGKFTCAARPPRSTTARTFRSHRESFSGTKPRRHRAGGCERRRGRAG